MVPQRRYSDLTDSGSVRPAGRCQLAFHPTKLAKGLARAWLRKRGGANECSSQYR